MPDVQQTPADEQCESVVLVNRRGLHARAAARFVREAAPFDAEIYISKDGVRVSGRSIMGLMMLAASCGTQLVLCASGSQAAEALVTLSDLIKRGFDED